MFYCIISMFPHSSPVSQFLHQLLNWVIFRFWLKSFVSALVDELSYRARYTCQKSIVLFRKTSCIFFWKFSSCAQSNSRDCISVLLLKLAEPSSSSTLTLTKKILLNIVKKKRVGPWWKFVFELISVDFRVEMTDTTQKYFD